MMSLRRLDEQGMRDYLEELRPRFVTLRLTTGKIRIWWGMPLWAFEEVLSFGLRLLPLLPHLTPLLPTRARAALGAWQTSNTEGLTAAVTTLLSERGRDLLRLPRGEPFVSIDTGEVSIEIRQI